MIFRIIVNLGTFLIIAMLSTSALTYIGVGSVICVLMELFGFALWEIFFFKNVEKI